MGLTRRATADHGDASPPESPEAEVASLSSDDAVLRRRAAVELFGRDAAVPDVLAAWDVEVDPTVREALATTLAATDDPTVALALAPCLASEDAQLRNLTVRTLQAMPRGASAVVQRLLADEDPDVRVLAVMVLSALEHHDVPRWLRGVADQDPE